MFLQPIGTRINSSQQQSRGHRGLWQETGKRVSSTCSRGDKLLDLGDAGAAVAGCADDLDGSSSGKNGEGLLDLYGRGWGLAARSVLMFEAGEPGRSVARGVVDDLGARDASCGLHFELDAAKLVTWIGGDGELKSR